MARELTPTHSQIIRERWLRGRLGYKLHAGQQKLKVDFFRNQGWPYLRLSVGGHGANEMRQMLKG
jgi:hypothetical protein